MFVIETTPRFDKEIVEVLDFTAKDSFNRALEFYDTLMEKLHNIAHNPLIYRQRENSSYHTRELIFKGYTIPFYIDEALNIIFILGIFNQNLWEE
ncbi:MAG: type II toxin-antitoxin system RelE/ParE family toxin [Campylobacterales bacterium]|nr:type II toxin-antitoxin system RelE/ParE family toxin [Campylobacterales bacterium]